MSIHNIDFCGANYQYFFSFLVAVIAEKSAVSVPLFISSLLVSVSYLLARPGQYYQTLQLHQILKYAAQV